MKLLLLDKDGTLVAPVSGAKFVQSPWDQAAISGVEGAIARYVSEGWTPVIVSNQGGVKAGFKSLESCILEMQFCLELFPAILEAYFCPDGGMDCWRAWGNCSEEHRILYGNGWTSGGYKLASFRKPGPGMLQLAIDIHAPDQVIYVGDRPEDQAAAQAAGLSFMWADEWRA